jgi:hypothetical protein
MKKARSQAQSEEAHVSMRKEKRKKEIQLLASHGDFYSSMSLLVFIDLVTIQTC